MLRRCQPQRGFESVYSHSETEIIGGMDAGFLGASTTQFGGPLKIKNKNSTNMKVRYKSHFLKIKVNILD